MMYIMHTRVPTKSIKNNLVHNESENGTRGTKNQITRYQREHTGSVLYYTVGVGVKWKLTVEVNP